MVSATLKLLLIQVRAPGDPMAAHEASCVRRRLADLPVDVAAANVLETPAEVGWLDGCDAFVIGGSGAYSVHDPRSAGFVDPLRSLLEASLQRGTPGFGICFGHQLLGLHLGRPVETLPELAEVGTGRFALTDAGANDDVLGRLPATFHGHTGHSDSVLGVPDGVDLLATSDTLDTQVFRVRGTRMYTAQFHPDLTGQEARDRYEAYRRALREAGAEPPEGDPEAYVPGADEGAALLHLWAERVLEGLEG